MNLYFAYGSNLSWSQIQRRCPTAQPIEQAWLNNHRLAFRGTSGNWSGGVATVERSRGSRVPGVVYNLSDADLAQLDRCEGHPWSYRRELANVVAMHDPLLEYRVWTYRKQQGHAVLPGPMYLATMMVGYIDWGFDVRRLPPPGKLRPQSFARPQRNPYLGKTAGQLNRELRRQLSLLS